MPPARPERRSTRIPHATLAARQRLTLLLCAPARVTRSAVTRNYSEKVINKVLDLVSGSQQMELLQTFYETTLVALQARCPP